MKTIYFYQVRSKEAGGERAVLFHFLPIGILYLAALYLY